MLENPRIIKRAPADADSGAAGVIEHFFGGFAGGDIAIADDGNAFDSLRHGADERISNGARPRISR